MPKFQEQALIVSQQQVARATYRMRLQSPLIAQSGQAGQFVLVRILDSWDPLLRRPFSFHRLFPGRSHRTPLSGRGPRDRAPFPVSAGRPAQSDRASWQRIQPPHG